MVSFQVYLERKKILLWDDYQYLKRLIQERNRQNRKKNGTENTKQLNRCSEKPIIFRKLEINLMKQNNRLFIVKSGEK